MRPDSVMYRTLLRLTSTVCRPLAAVELSDSGGRYLYLRAGTGPVSVTVPLERDQVRELAEAALTWLAEHPGDRAPATGGIRSALYGRTDRWG